MTLNFEVMLHSVTVLNLGMF